MDKLGSKSVVADLAKSPPIDIESVERIKQAIKRGETPPIPTNSISKEPSAELRPGQKDSDSLPEYPILDQILAIYIEKAGSVDAIVVAGFDRALAEKVILMVDRAEFKRRQYPPGPKVTSLAFGKDRRLPMTSHWRESR